MGKQKDQKSANDFSGLLPAMSVSTQAPQHRIGISEVWNTTSFFNRLQAFVIEIFGHVLYTKA